MENEKIDDSVAHLGSIKPAASATAMMTVRTLTADEIEDKVREEVDSYRKFAFKDDLLQTVVAFTIVTMFNKMLTAFTESFLMPVVKFLIGSKEATWSTLKWVPVPGLIFDTGKFIGATVDFLMISFILYIVWVKILRKPDSSTPLPTPPKKKRRKKHRKPIPNEGGGI